MDATILLFWTFLGLMFLSNITLSFIVVHTIGETRELRKELIKVIKENKKVLP